MWGIGEHLEVWRVAFEDDQNGVVPTLVNIAWNHAVFMSVAKAIELAPKDAEGQKPLNSSVLGLLLHDIADHATVYFAHAANRESREGRGIGRWSAKEATDALRILVETAELIGRWFLYRNVGLVLLTAQFDPFQHLDKSLLREADEPVLRAQWDAFDEEANGWAQLDDADL